MRVAVIHGNRLCGDLLCRVAATLWGCEVVANECSIEEGLAAIHRAMPDVVILGHHPPIVDCLEILSSLRRYGSMKLVVSARRVTEYLVHKLAAYHVHAVIEESSSSLDELQAAVGRVRDGLRWLSSRYVHLAAHLRENPQSFPKMLSKRQEEILVCIAHELEDEEIAQRLGMTPATAERHRADIMRKLDLHKTTRLIRYAVQAGFDEAKLPR